MNRASTSCTSTGLALTLRAAAWPASLAIWHGSWPTWPQYGRADAASSGPCTILCRTRRGTSGWNSSARCWLCRMAPAVIVHGHAGREAAVESFGCPANRVFVIPHGHYREAYGPPLPGPDARQRLGLPGDARVFLFFGYLPPYKGLELLFDAWRIEPAGTRCSWSANRRRPIMPPSWQNGSRPRRSAVARPLCAARRGPGFLQCGGRGGAALSAVQTSGSLLLAMSYGLLVIAPRLGELPETLADAADLLFSAGDEEDLRRQLSRR